jgi:hypothetical protein
MSFWMIFEDSTYRTLQTSKYTQQISRRQILSVIIIYYNRLQQHSTRESSRLGSGLIICRRIRDSWRQTQKNANRMRGALVKHAILAKCSGHRPVLISRSWQNFLFLTLNRLCLAVYSLEVTVGAIFCDINKLRIFPCKNLNASYYKHWSFSHTTLTGLCTRDDRSFPWGVTCTFKYNLDQRQSTTD